MTERLQCRALILTLVFSLLLALPANSSAQQPASPTNKIYSNILAAISQLKSEGITARNAHLMNLPKRFQNGLIRFDDQGRVGLQIRTSTLTTSVLSSLRSIGANILLSIPPDNLIIAYVPIDRVETVAALPEIKVLRPITGGVTNFVTSEGDSVHHARDIRSDLHVLGDSINVGVISDGCVSWMQAVISGDLPAAFGPPNFTYAGGGLNKIGLGDEGTAMMEIIHDLAPQANLYFYGALYDALGSFAHIDAIHRLVREKQCKIIVDDLTWYDQPMFEDGDVNTANTVAAAAQWANDTGVVYISSAGNWADGPPHIINRTHYQALYSDNNPALNNGVKPLPQPMIPPGMVPPIPPVAGGPLPMWPYRDLHNFSTVVGVVDPALTVIVPGWTGYEPTTLHIILEWADPPSLPNDPDAWGSSADDYDLYLYDAGLSRIVASSTIAQMGNQDPREQIDFTNLGHTDSTYNIVINHLDTIPQLHPPKLLGMYISGCSWVEYFTPQNSIWGQPGIADVIAVGAVPWNNSSVIEPFSSIGNYDVYLPAFMSRPKPDVLAVDGVTISGAGGSFLPPFFGTSAAAPHVAAMAALILSKCKEMTPAQVHAKFERTALPLTGSVPDPTYGYGFADIQRALLEVDTAVGQTNLYTMNNNVNVPMFYATGDGYAMNTATVTGGLNQPTTVSSRVSVTSGSPYADALVQELSCPTVNRWFQLTQTGGISGGYNTVLTAYIDESERQAAGVSINNLRILHYNGGIFDILTQAAAPQQIRNTWVIKATFNNASLSPFFVAYLERGVDAATVAGNSGSQDSTVTVRFSIQNTGNGWDSLSYHTRDTRSWTLVPTDSAFSLGPAALSNFDIRVTISHTDTAGTVDTVWLTAKSVSDPTLIDSSYATVTVVPGISALSYHMDAGWNMVSVPLQTADRCRYTLYPSVVSKAFMYKGGYVPKDTLDYCTGYWVKFDSAKDIEYTGLKREIDTVDVDSVWNMIGSISAPVDIDSIVQIPEHIVASPFYTYNGGYLTKDSIEPGKAYWVRTNHAGKLVLKHSSASSNQSHLKSSVPLAGLSSIHFADRLGGSQTLYLGSAGKFGGDLAGYDLPPIPPEGSFDVRFRSQRILEVYDVSVSKAIYPVDVQTSDPLCRVTGKVVDQNITVYLTDGTDWIVELSPGKTVTLPVGSQRFQLVVKGRIHAQPEQWFALEAAYPNPFNPSTTIRYHLPVESKVALRVYDMFGRVVAVLKDGIEDAGLKEVEWNASRVASGIYFYKLTATSAINPTKNFSQMKKLILIR